jgi:hypothetical protein
MTRKAPFDELCQRFRTMSHLARACSCCLGLSVGDQPSPSAPSGMDSKMLATKDSL